MLSFRLNSRELAALGMYWDFWSTGSSTGSIADIFEDSHLNGHMLWSSSSFRPTRSLLTTGDGPVAVCLTIRQLSRLYVGQSPVIG